MSVRSIRSESISIHQAADMLGENENTLRRWVRQGSLEGTLIIRDDEEEEQGVTRQSLDRVQGILGTTGRRGR